jgi:DNA polymerase I-like protein with 3'-5' exonuclease and polymerase domains
MQARVARLGEDNTFEYSYLREKDIVRFFKNPTLLSNTVVIDIETYPRKKYEYDEDGALLPEKAKIRTLQMFDGTTCVILDFMNMDGSYALLNPWIVEQLQKFLLSKKLVAHNALFETSHLQRLFTVFYGKVKPLNIYCTMNAYRLVTKAYSCNDFGASLDAVAKAILQVELPKESQTSDWSAINLTDEQIQYCALDAITPYFIWLSVANRLEDLDMVKVFHLNTEAQEAIAHMRIHGIGFNKEEHAKITKEWKKEKDRLELECIKALNRDKSDISDEDYKEILLDKVIKRFKEPMARKCSCSLGKGRDATVIYSDLNLMERLGDKEEDPALRKAYRRVAKNLKAFLISPNSVKQKSDWFRANVSKKDLEQWPESEASGHLKMDKDTLPLFDHIPEAKLLLDYGYYAKLYSTYGVGFMKHILDVDSVSKIYTNFTLCKTNTGRMSSYAPNMQNLVRTQEVRSLFQSYGENRKILCADFSQIEVRVAAELSKDTTMLEAYRTGKDIHKITAAAMSHKRIEEVTKEERQAGKACFSGDTEILTENGWCRFDEYDGQNKVAQYTPSVIPNDPTTKFDFTGDITFTYPIDFKKFYNRRVYLMEDKGVSILCTGDHNILYTTYRDYLKTLRADNICKPNIIRHIISAGYYDIDSELNEYETRLLAACISDGTTKSKGKPVQFNFKRLHKINRLHNLCKRANVVYRCYTNKKSGYTIFYVEFKDIVEKYANDGKTLEWDCIHRLNGYWYLDEARYWDGGNYTSRKDSFRFTSVNKQTLDIMQAMACLSGMTARIRPSGKTGYSNTDRFELFYRTESLPRLRTDAYFIKQDKKIPVYCVQVPSGYIILRRKDKVFILNNCVFGLLYGAGAETLKKYAKKSYNVVMTDEEAAKAVQTFRTTYPEYREWQISQAGAAEKELTVKTPLGKIRTLPEDGYYTRSMNTPVQGGAGEIMLEALVRIWTYIQEHDVDAYLVNVVHDEVLVDCHDDDVEEMQEAIKTSMCNAVLSIFPDASVKDLVDKVGVGDNWAEAK